MKNLLLSLTVLPALASCNSHEDAGTKREAQPPAPPSRELAAHFPLLPMIEKAQWSQLLEAEKRQAAASDAEREAAAKEVQRLAGLLQSRHPFKAGDDIMELGGIVCDRVTHRLRIPAKVEFPKPGDERHPDEVELLLCTEGGRRHETLFITQARPLHLELLLRLGDYARGSRFRIEAITAEGTRIPVDSLIRATGGEALESPLFWEFSGSDYKDIYSPDLSGDFAIFWHAHDSVLRVKHEEIASGVVKLAPVPHPKLKNGDPVVLELLPVGNETCR